MEAAATKSLEYITAQPFEVLRRAVSEKFLSKTLNPPVFDQLMQQLEEHLHATHPDQEATFKKELRKARQSLASGARLIDPDIETPALQLMWGAALAIAVSDRVAQNKPKFSNSTAKATDGTMWRAIAATEEASRELQEMRFEIANSLRNPNIHMQWGTPPGGYPGIGFFFSPDNNYINLDLPWALITGLTHARAITMHEIAHGLGTIAFTVKMQSIRERMKKLEENKHRSRDAHIELAKLGAQWDARFMLFDESENNYANRFACNKSSMASQDYSVSLNHVEHTISDVGDEFRAHRTEPPVFENNPPASEQFRNLKRAIRYAFFSNNELFPANDESWRKIGINPDWLEAKGTKGSKRKLKGTVAFGELLALCKKLEELQPLPGDRMQGAEHYRRKTVECNQQRNAVIDEIFDRFAAHLLPDIEKQAKQQMDEKLDRQQEQNQQDGKQPSPSDGDESDKGDQAAQQPGGKDGDAQDGQGKNQDQEAQADGKAEAGKEAQPQPSKGKPGKDGNAQKEKAFVEGVGEVQEVPLPAATPSEARGIPEFIPVPKPMPGRGEPMMAAALESAPSAEPDDNDTPPLGGGRQYGLKKDDPPPAREGDLDAYQRLIAPHKYAIRSVAKLFKKIQERQTYRIPQISKDHSLFPEDGDPMRFREQTHVDLMVKRFSGQDIQTSDYDRFSVDCPQKRIPAPIDIAILIDGSGSMEGKPIETAIRSACILYEAAKEAGLNVYISMFGAASPYQIAKPGDTSADISKRIESVCKGQSYGSTWLMPAIKATLNTIVKTDGRRNPDERMGSSHAFVITDGIFGDDAQVGEAVRHIAHTCPHMTFDFILMPNDGGYKPEITDVAAKVNEAMGRTKIGCKPVGGVDGIQNGLMDLLNQRLTATRHTDAVTIAEKQNEFKKTRQRL